MKLGILGAMPEEIDGIKKLLSSAPNQFLDTLEIAKREFHRFKTKHHEIILVFSRWGKVAASISTTLLINEFKVDAVIFTGVAGAAHEDLSVGDIVIGNKTIQHDMDTSPIFPKYQIPLTETSYFHADSQLVELATLAATQAVADAKLKTLPIALFNKDPLKVCQGTLASGDKFIGDKATVTQMAIEIENLFAVDMESAAVAHVCMDFGIPYVAIRVMSDKADGTAHVDFLTFTQQLASPLDALIVEKLIPLIPVAL